ncbi:MAG: hypothetical protein ABI907_11065, partial [Ramlibacter sp.]
RNVCRKTCGLKLGLRINLPAQSSWKPRPALLCAVFFIFYTGIHFSPNPARAAPALGLAD